MFMFTTTAFAPREEDLEEFFFDPTGAQRADDEPPRLAKDKAPVESGE